MDGTRFELGVRPLRRNSRRDWDAVVESAKSGAFADIPGDVLIRCFGNIQRIAAHFATPVAAERECFVYWGKTGMGKSRRAWAEGGLDSYPKLPSTKFWDGYAGQAHVIIDEFRGEIGIGHLLRWLDRYPVLVEIKGSMTVLRATKIWITSNLSPDLWYPDLDPDTYDALRRRIKVTHFDSL